MSLSAEDAFSSVYGQFHSELCKYAFDKLKDELMAEDVVVETFMKLLQQGDRFRTERNLKGYLYKVVDKICSNYERRQRIEEKRSAEIDYLSAQVEESEIAHELNKLIENEISKLPPQRKLIMEQLFMEGLSSQQVAAKMKLSRQTVLNQKVRAIEALREKFLNKFFK